MKKKIILMLVLFTLIMLVFFVLKTVKSSKQLTLTGGSIQDNVNDIARNYTKEQRLNDINLINLANSEKKLSYCVNIIEAYTRDLCYDQAAKRDLNADICTEIIDKNTKLMCDYFVFVELAVNNKDVSICQKLQLNNLIDNCIKSYERKIKCNNESCLDVK